MFLGNSEQAGSNFTKLSSLRTAWIKKKNYESIALTVYDYTSSSHDALC